MCQMVVFIMPTVSFYGVKHKFMQRMALSAGYAMTRCATDGMLNVMTEINFKKGYSTLRGSSLSFGYKYTF